MEFANKEYLLLLLLLIPYIVWYLLYNKKTEPAMRMSDTFAFQYAHKSFRQQLVWLPAVLRMIVFTLIVICLARPQTQTSWGKRTTEGIDIMLAMDVSTSMLGEDLKPNRIEASKSVAAEFIADRPDDNIGLTVFAGEAFTQCPLTTDHKSLLNLLANVRTDLAMSGLIDDGTAIGMGIANSINRLKEDKKAKSKVIILLTDGSNNMGDISPLTAAQIAKSLGIRVYTIAVGTDAVVRYPVTVGGATKYINRRGDLDTQTLMDVARATDGHFYRATNTSELKNIYKEIDKLEKTKMDVKHYSRHYDAYQPFALAAFVILLIEILLRITVFRRIP